MTNTPETPTSVTETAQTPETVQTQILTKLSKSGGQLRERVIDELSEKELQRRTSIAIRSMEVVEEKEKELKNVKPQREERFNEKGEAIMSMPYYVKADIQKMDKLKGEIKTIGETLERLLSEKESNKEDWDKFEKTLGSNKSEKKENNDK